MMKSKKATLIKSYVGRVKDPETLMKSSSGGAFTAFSDLALRLGYGIVCCIYDYSKNTVEYRIVEDESSRNSARGSKYVHSDLGDIYVQIKEWLFDNKGRKLMFFGMGCEAAGLVQYLESLGLRERCIVVDIVCHGTCSPRIWKDYILLKEDKYGNLSNVDFKDKRRGWNHPTAVGKFGDKEIALDEYMKIYYSNKAMRPSCHTCRFSTKYRRSDITIGDAWGLKGDYGQLCDERGYSLILVHSDEGLSILEQCKNSFDFFEISEEECDQPNLIRPTPVSLFRENFWNEYNKRGIRYILKKYGRHSSLLVFQEKLKTKIATVTGKTNKKDSSDTGICHSNSKRDLEDESAQNDKTTPRLFKVESECCGCTACMSICAKSAIIMQEDKEGYLYPVIDSKKCIGCKRCIEVCPLK